VLFIPSCPGYTGLTGALDRSDRCNSRWVFARVNVWVCSLLSCVAAVSSLGQFGGRLACLLLSGTALGGPLKQLGNPHLKPATKSKPNTPYLTMQDMAHAAKAPAAHQAAHSKIPSSRLRLARRRVPPLGGLRPVRGGALTSSRLHLARGSAPPSNGVHLARGHSARARLLPYAGI
jgi:hypothetical protein